MIEQTTIQRARQTDLPSFLKAKGEPLIKSGKRWQHRDHDSLIILCNMFFWNSRQAKGNSLDFVMLYYGWSFEQAVQELTSFDNAIKKEQAILKKEKEEEPGSFHIIQAPDNKRVIAYLCQTRNVDYHIIRKLIECHHLAQDNHGNAVFKIYDEKRELIGAELCGTLSTVRFKGIAEGTRIGYGFNFTVGEPTKTLFFESPIDFLSFWTLNMEIITAHRLVSLAGLRQDIFKNILEKFEISPETAYLCVDNDKAGREFIRTIQSQYANIKIHIPKTTKDWNNLLTKSKKEEQKRER